MEIPRTNTLLYTRIACAEDAIAFIRALHLEDRLYHFDDSPETVVNTGTGQRIFNDAECHAVRARVAEMRAIEGFDPFEVALSC